MLFFAAASYFRLAASHLAAYLLPMETKQVMLSTGRLLRPGPARSQLLGLSSTTTSSFSCSGIMAQAGADSTPPPSSLCHQAWNRLNVCSAVIIDSQLQSCCRLSRDVKNIIIYRWRLARGVIEAALIAIISHLWTGQWVVDHFNPLISCLVWNKKKQKWETCLLPVSQRPGSLNVFFLFIELQQLIN